VAIVLFFIVLALVMPSMFEEKKTFPKIIVIAAVVIALYIFGDALGWFRFSSSVKIEGTWLGDPANQTILLVLFAFIAVVWFIVGGKGDSGKSTTTENIGSFLKWLFEAGGGNSGGKTK